MALFAAGVLAAAGGCGSAERPAASVTSRATESTPSRTPTATPKVTKRKVTVRKRIPYKTRRVKDRALARGHTVVRISGRSGVRTLTYVVTYADGERTGRRLVRTRVTRHPTTKVIAVGAKKKVRNCDPNYTGACVPIAGDVDCAGNDGNGPAYVNGPVRVVGNDVYDLDRDGDGIACD